MPDHIIITDYLCKHVHCGFDSSNSLKKVGKDQQMTGKVVISSQTNLCGNFHRKMGLSANYLVLLIPVLQRVPSLFGTRAVRGVLGWNLIYRLYFCFLVRNNALY